MHHRIRHGLAALIAFGALQAQAADSHYDFDVHWTGGSLFGTTSTGSLSFDASLAVPSLSYAIPDLLNSFQFTVAGHTYGLSDVSVGWLTFDAEGVLSSFGIGTDCSPGLCVVRPLEDRAFSLVLSNPSVFASISDLPNAYGAYGSGKLTPSTVPEPASWALMMGGLGMLGAARARRRVQASA